MSRINAGLTQRFTRFDVRDVILDIEACPSCTKQVSVDESIQKLRVNPRLQTQRPLSQPHLANVGEVLLMLGDGAQRHGRLLVQLSQRQLAGIHSLQLFPDHFVGEEQVSLSGQDKTQPLDIRTGVPAIAGCCP